MRVTGWVRTMVAPQEVTFDHWERLPVARTQTVGQRLNILPTSCYTKCQAESLTARRWWSHANNKSPAQNLDDYCVRSIVFHILLAFICNSLSPAQMKKENNNILTIFLTFVTAISLQSWSTHASFFDPIGPFEDIKCNQVLADSTIGATNSYSNSDYGTCATVPGTFDAGDRLYRLDLADSTEVSIQLNNLDGANLVMVLLSNTTDPESQVECPDTCITFSDGGDIDAKLGGGTYWIIVDGIVPVDGGAPGEGKYELTVVCEKEYDPLPCGQILTHTTLGRASNFNILDYGGCFEELVNTYEAGDRLYRFEILETQTVDIVLEKLDNQGLHMFLLASVPDENGQACPGSCFAKSDTGSVIEQITRTLPLGIYWIAVDGMVLPSSPDDLVNEGSYNLYIDCPKDINEISCGSVVLGSTDARLDQYGSSDYGSCAVGDYSQGDVTYEWEVLTGQEMKIDLTPMGEDDLDLILMSGALDTATGIYCPDTCVAIAAATTGAESISITLAPGTYFLMVDGIADAGPYMLEISCSPLPIQLTHFGAQKEDNGVMIEWQTASEFAFEGFMLQRSSDGTTWSDLGWSPARGDVNTATTYDYMDKTPLRGTNYYRLQAFDLDGSVELSGIVQVAFNDTRAPLVVYPTVSHDFVRIKGISIGETAKYELRTLLGEVVGAGEVAESAEIDISPSPSGALLLTIDTGDGERRTFRILKQP